MSQKARQQTEQDSALSTLDVSIKYLNIAKDTSSIKPAKDAFGSVNVLLTMIRVRVPLPRELFIHVHLGHHGKRTRLRRTWNVLR